MKMVMAVVPRDGAENILQVLVNAGHTATISESRGGMLRQAQQVLFIAVEEESLELILSIIRDNCHSEVVVARGDSERAFSIGPTPVRSQLGGAVVFTWELDRFETY